MGYRLRIYYTNEKEKKGEGEYSSGLYVQLYVRVL
jgi:hypothetical protein